MSKAQILVVGACAGGLSCAIQLAKQRSDAAIRVMQSSDADLSATSAAAAPAMLHTFGASAVKSIAAAITPHPVGPRLLIDRSPVDAHKLYGEGSALVAQEHLLAALLTEAAALSNLSILTSSQVCGVDAAAGTIAVRDVHPVFGTSYAAYDMPSVLVLADGCTSLLQQLGASGSGLVRSCKLQKSHRSGIIVPDVPVQLDAAIQAFSTSDMLVVLFTQERVAHVSASAGAVAVLSDSDRLAQQLEKAGAPASAAAAVCSAVKHGLVAVKDCTAGSHSPAIQTTRNGSTIALIADSLVAPAAALCLSTDVALHTAVATAAALKDSGDVAEHNAAMSALARAALLAGDKGSALLHLGTLTGSTSMRSVQALCKGKVVRSRFEAVSSVPLAPYNAVISLKTSLRKLVAGSAKTAAI